MIELDLERLQPLRLAQGSHARGSGRGCAMNVISWENGDKEITDFPDCADRFLAHIVQWVNDRICGHSRELGMICAGCAVPVLALAHRTVGTTLPDTRATHMVYLNVAANVAEQVPWEAAPWVDRGMIRASVAAVRGWMSGRYTLQDIGAMRKELGVELTSFMPSTMANTVTLAALLLEAVPDHNPFPLGGATPRARAVAAVTATLQLAMKAQGVEPRDGLLPFVHTAVFDKFEEVTGITPEEPDVERIVCAVREMATVRA